MSAVEHPKHYQKEGRMECIEEIRQFYGDEICAIFCLTNAYKYLYRAGLKNDAKEDVAKARWYVNYYLKNFPNLSDMANYNDSITKLEEAVLSEIDTKKESI